MAPLEYLARNQAAWAAWAAEYLERGRRNWERAPKWGIWDIPEDSIHVLPDVIDKDVVEIGCGTAYLSAWIARRGGRPVGVDPTAAQLKSARLLQDEFSLHFPLLLAPGERLPFRDGSFDLAISEYGASIWADPYHWVPEAARVLRPGGRLIFLCNGTLLMLCAPDSETDPATPELIRPYFGMHRFEWSDDDSVEFHLGYGDWIRLLRASGFEVEDLVELRPVEDATTEYPFVTLEWARNWPSEEVWKAIKKP